MLALLAFKRGRVTEAAYVLGRADAGYSAHDQARDPVEKRIRDTLFEGLQHAVRTADLNQLLVAGAALSDDEAARMALVA